MRYEVGLLWRIEPKKPLQVNIEDGIRKHQEKFGQPAEVVDVNPKVLGDQIIVLPGVVIRAEKSVLVSEIFVGRKIG